MKKIFLLIALICFLSVVNATMMEEPFSKEDFRGRMNAAISHNRQQYNILINYNLPGEETTEEQLKTNKENLDRLDELKIQAIKEYNVFFDAYHSADLVKVNEQNLKLKNIFDEMNLLMYTVVKFEGIYDNVLYWTLKLGYLIDKGVVDPEKKLIDNSKPIKAITNKGLVAEIDDCCVSAPGSKCCKAKIQADCCVIDSDSECCKQKQSQGSLLVPVALILGIIVIALLYAGFARKR